MNKNASYFPWLQPLLIIVLLLGIYFRFVNLDRKVYWIDEVHTSLRVSGYTREEFVEQVPEGKIITIEDLQKFQQLKPDTSLGQTVKGLASSEHSPLYYFLTRFWMQLFGSSITVTRSLAAALSLLAFPCIYWLCLELFASPLVGWISVALLAVSPFHVLYAQEAREYSLLTVTILLASATLLWALRRKTNISWLIYAVTVALGLYAHPLAGLVFLGHGIHVLITEKYRFNKTFKTYVIASLAGLFAFAPWIYVFIVNGDGVGDWVTKEISLYTLFQRWFLNLSSLFFDVQVGYKEQLFNIETGQDLKIYFTNPVIYIAISIFVLVAYSIYFFCRYASKKARIFIFTLTGVTALVLLLPDLISGGQRSTVGRYVIACYLGIEIAVAYCIATKITLVKSGISYPFLQQKFWQLITVTLIFLGIISCVTVSQSDTWWNKYSSYYNYQVAQIINQTESPLVISNTKRVSRLTSLSYLLHPDARLLLVDITEKPEIPNSFSNVFLFRPYGELLQEFEQDPNYKIKSVHPLGHLWQVEK